jgi:hypothetical protein
MPVPAQALPPHHRALTLAFVLEFASRLLAAFDRLQCLATNDSGR